MKIQSDHWILKNPLWDVLFISFAGFGGILIASLFPLKSVAFSLYGFLVLAVLDGHIYITGWRTVFNKEERGSHPIYWMVPLGTFVTVIIWMKLQVPYLWMAVIYATFFHHVRQYYGFSRWYQKFNQRYCLWSNFYVQALIVVPFIIFHFRGFETFELYTNERELFAFSAPGLFQIGLWIYGILLLSWIIFELRLFLSGKKEVNRFFAICGPGALACWCFLFANSIAEIALPLLMQHAIAYFAIMGHSLRKINPQDFKGWGKVTSILVISAIIFVFIERFFLEEWMTTFNYHYTTQIVSLGQMVLTGLYITPLMCHYIWDAYIWTGKHRLAKKVFE